MLVRDLRRRYRCNRVLVWAYAVVCAGLISAVVHIGIADPSKINEVALRHSIP